MITTPEEVAIAYRELTFEEFDDDGRTDFVRQYIATHGAVMLLIRLTHRPMERVFAALDYARHQVRKKAQ